MVFLTLDRTLDNLVQFCSDSQSSIQPVILTFDPTFSLGEFDVTVSTYKHPLIVFHEPTEHIARHPSLIGPVLIRTSEKTICKLSLFHIYACCIPSWTSSFTCIWHRWGTGISSSMPLTDF